MEATTFTMAFSMDRGPLDMLVQIVHAGKTDAVLPEQPWPEHTRHVTERLGHDDHDPAARGQSGRRDEPKQRRTGMDPSLGHGQHPRQRGHPGRHQGRFPTRRAVLHPAAKHVLLAALRRGRLPQLQELHPGASERHSCPLRPRRHLRRLGHETEHVRRQSSAEWAARAVTDLCDENQAWTTGSPRRGRAHSHAHDELFSRHIELEPAPEDPVDWAMAEASDDKNDAPMSDAPPEPEIIDMPPAPASLKTTPQKTRLRDVKYARIWDTD